MILNDPAIELAQLPDTLNEIYAKLLDQARASGASDQTFRQVVGLLAVAGEGPVLPISLLVQACETLGGPEGSHGVRVVLDRLGGLVARRDAGTTEEHAGLFRATLAEYLLDPSASGAGFPLDARAMHEAMIQAIDALATTAKHDRSNPVHHYAMLREADHLWALGNAERTLASLRSRELPEPSENLRRWLQWLRRFRERFDEDDAHVLDLRGSIASATSRSGEAQEALRLCAELLPEAVRALGRDHPITLTTRGRIAYLTGDTGDVQEALRLLAELLSDQERALGRDHADLLKTRRLHSRTGRGWATGNRRCGYTPSYSQTRSEYLAPTTPTRFRSAIASRIGPAKWATRRRPCGSRPSYCWTRSACWAAIIPTRSECAESWRTGRAVRANRGRRYGCSSTSCRIRSEFWAAITQILSPCENISRAGPPRPVTPRRHCIFEQSCCRTRSACWAATMPIRSTPATTSRRTRPRLARRARRCVCSPSCWPTRSGCSAAMTGARFETRFSIASGTGDVLEASRLLQELVPDFEGELGARTQ